MSDNALATFLRLEAECRMLIQNLSSNES